MTVRPAVWLAAAAVFAADLATKEWALATLEPREEVSLIGEFLSLRLVLNPGAAFSLGESSTWVLTIVQVVVTGALIWYARRARTRLGIALFGIGLGGAVGNLVDRLFREPGFGRGHVVDMINYNDYFVGNVADIAIVGAAAALVIASMTGHRLLEPAEKRDGDAATP